MEKGVEKILLERQVAKDRGVLGAVNVAVWHRSVVRDVLHTVKHCDVLNRYMIRRKI
jgi:hypothetical protein